MGNANNKGPIPPPSSKPPPQGMVKRLQEDITCSICLDILEDPVSIECGHNFCRGCLAAHWSGVSAWGSQCPECRAPCSRDRMIPDTRVKSLVLKIRDLPCEETPTATGTASPEGMVKRLQEDVTCSICLDILEDPVSIECGHNFCRGCLTAHWSGVSAWGSQCPECRAPCSRGRMIPDTRVKSLVLKIRDLPCEEMPTATGTASPETLTQPRRAEPLAVAPLAMSLLDTMCPAPAP
ncbi:hypothetical protein KIL84_007719 [Mauremys mutica]|uniref:RING-type domain-containing protein n=1 Tax=Mauremys mutica TaxID=74926 RepID=A0A9D3X2E1_9SAUR|nr:hypothetical protein KIL84_007719 [Mauremys mutica]